MFLLSLVGEQPIPVLIPLWQKWANRSFSNGAETCPFTSIQFAGSRSTMPVIANLEAVIRREPCLAGLEIQPPLLVDPYEIQSTRKQIQSTLDRSISAGNTCVVNLSGGTKLMALAALQAARSSPPEKGIPEPVVCLYVNTEKNQLIFLDAAGEDTGNEEIRVEISIQQYLEAHGLHVSDNQAFNPHGANCQAIPPKTGDVLESRVESLSRVSGYFDEVRRNVFIRKPVPDGKSVSNELDVVAISNGRLVVCSCKAGVNLKKEMLYELAALSRREVAGIYCGKVLALGQDVIPPGMFERAKADGIRLVPGSEVDRIALIMHLETR